MDLEEAIEELKFEIDNKMIRRTIFTNQAIEKVLEELEYLKKENEKMNSKIIEEIEILKKHKNNNSNLDFTHNDLMDSAITALEELLKEE